MEMLYTYISVIFDIFYQISTHMEFTNNINLLRFDNVQNESVAEEMRTKSF